MSTPVAVFLTASEVVPTPGLGPNSPSPVCPLVGLRRRDGGLGGANGSIRFDEELSRRDNRGLRERALPLIQPLVEVLRCRSLPCSAVSHLGPVNAHRSVSRSNCVSIMSEFHLPVVCLVAHFLFRRHRRLRGPKRETTSPRWAGPTPSPLPAPWP